MWSETRGKDNVCLRGFLFKAEIDCGRMKTLFLVKPEEAEKAREIENRLLRLSPSSGISFVGVSVVPGADPLFRVWVGCDRSMDETVIQALAQSSLREEIRSGSRFEIEVHRGVVRNQVDAAK